MHCKKCNGSKIWDDGICKLCGTQNEVVPDKRITIPCSPPPAVKDPYFTDLDDVFKHMFGMADECLIPMPKGIKYYNGCNEPCDMAQGPCCCGAWHKWKEWYRTFGGKT